MPPYPLTKFAALLENYSICYLYLCYEQLYFPTIERHTANIYFETESYSNKREIIRNNFQNSSRNTKHFRTGNPREFLKFLKNFGLNTYLMMSSQFELNLGTGK